MSLAQFGANVRFLFGIPQYKRTVYYSFFGRLAVSFPPNSTKNCPMNGYLIHRAIPSYLPISYQEPPAPPPPVEPPPQPPPELPLEEPKPPLPDNPPKILPTAAAVAISLAGLSFGLFFLSSWSQ